MMFFKKAKDDASQLEKLIADYRRKQSPNTLHQMMELFPKVTMFYTSLKTEVGPDNFPYANLHLRAENENQTTLKEVAEKALNDGFGVTINKNGNKVDWVFSLGDFISLTRAGVLVSNNGNTGFQSKRIEEEIKAQVGAPNEDIIPMAARKHLRNYLQTNLKIANPKFYIMFNPQDNPPHTIIFNFSRKDFRSEVEYQNALGFLSWFFPKTVFTGSIEKDTNQFFEI
jgi:hypothetical protein